MTQSLSTHCWFGSSQGPQPASVVPPLVLLAVTSAVDEPEPLVEASPVLLGPGLVLGSVVVPCVPCVPSLPSVPPLVLLTVVVGPDVLVGPVASVVAAAVVVAAVVEPSVALVLATLSPQAAAVAMRQNRLRIFMAMMHAARVDTVTQGRLPTPGPASGSEAARGHVRVFVAGCGISSDDDRLCDPQPRRPCPRCGFAVSAVLTRTQPVQRARSCGNSRVNSASSAIWWSA